MKIKYTFFAALAIMCTIVFDGLSQNRPSIIFNDLLISSEENPQMKLAAREIALK
ncbi:MAG: hypothetical protein IPI19_16225 [Ignavibacteriales bacterium]|nr:hypothetical protein [Ignavibacteriales bacterium]